MRPSLRITITNIAEVEDTLIAEWKKYFTDAQTSDTEIVLKPISTIESLEDAGKIIFEGCLPKIKTRIVDMISDELIDGGYISSLSAKTISGVDVVSGDSVMTTYLQSVADNTEIPILSMRISGTYTTHIDTEINTLIDLIKSKTYVTGIEAMNSTKIK